MAKRHRELMVRLDQEGLDQHSITEEDVRAVETYLSVIQADLKGGPPGKTFLTTVVTSAPAF